MRLAPAIQCLISLRASGSSSKPAKEFLLRKVAFSLALLGKGPSRVEFVCQLVHVVAVLVGDTIVLIEHQPRLRGKLLENEGHTTISDSSCWLPFASSCRIGKLSVTVVQ